MLDREGELGSELLYYLQIYDKQNVSAIRTLTVVVADEDDNPPSPGHKETLIYSYQGQSVSQTLVSTCLYCNIHVLLLLIDGHLTVSKYSSTHAHF